jgi:hypothetical protein
MKKRVAVIFCVFLCGALYAQQKQVVVKIVDSLSLVPQVRASVIIGTDPPVTAYSNDSGEVLVVFADDEKKKEVTVTMLGFQNRAMIIKASAGQVLFKLRPSPTQLPETEVFPDLPAHLLFGSKETQVLDYVVTPNYILVALYNYYKKRCYLVTLDAGLNITDEQPIPADFEKFHVSGIGYVYAITPSQVFELTIKKGLIQTKYITQARFYKTIQYYCGGHQKYLYLTQLAKTGQIRIFFHEDTDLKVIYDYNPFCVVINEGQQRTAIHEYNKAYIPNPTRKGQPKSMDMVTLDDLFPQYDPSEGDIIPGGFHTDTEFFKKEEMIKKFGEHPVYAPFFMADGGIMIFDFCKNTANKYRYNTDLISSDTIAFHKIAGWEPLVLKNEDDQLFTFYKNDSGKDIVHTLNTDNFSTVALKTLAHKGVTNIKISGQYVYYLQQPFFNKNNVFLFREKWSD